MAENQAYKLQIVAIICYISAIVGVSLRFYVRKCIVGILGIEDWLMAVALVLYTMYIAFVFTGIHYGTGQHHRDLPQDHVIMGVKYWYFCEWAYVLTTTIIKYAVGVFYLRIMVCRWQILVVKFVMAAVVLFGIAYFGCVVAQCIPVAFIWQRYAVPETYQGKCLPNVVILWGTYLHSILTACGDWTLGLLPVTLLWNARMDFSTKCMMCFVLGLGAIASTSTLVRLSVIHTILDLEDFLWNTFGIAIWSTVEPGVALLAAGLATIRPLLRTLFPSIFSMAIDNNVPYISSITRLSYLPPDSEVTVETTVTQSTAPSIPHIHPIRSPPPIPFSPTSPNIVPPFLLSPPPIPGIPLASDGIGHPPIADKGKGRCRMMGFGAGIRRAKSLRSITTAKSSDSRSIRDGYGNITIAYAEESSSSKAE